MRYVWRLVRNVDSIREGLQLWIMFAAGGFFIGLGWAFREIYDEWSYDMKLKLVDNAKARFRDYSSIALATSALMVAFWLSLPDDWKPFLPAAWVAKGTGLLALWGFIGKFIVQDPPKDKQ